MKVLLIKDIHQLRQYGHQARKQAVDKAMHIEKTEHELSIREIEVLILITKGLINKEIADKLQISTTAVEKHIAKALQCFSKHFKDKYPVDIYIIIIAWVIMNNK